MFSPYYFSLFSSSSSNTLSERDIGAHAPPKWPVFYPFCRADQLNQKKDREKNDDHRREDGLLFFKYSIRNRHWRSWSSIPFLLLLLLILLILHMNISHLILQWPALSFQCPCKAHCLGAKTPSLLFSFSQQDLVSLRLTQYCLSP